MLSAWLPGGNWMLKVTNQEVHNCSQRGGWVGRMLKIFPQDAPSCPYKYWLVTLRASSCLLAASSHITSRVVTTH